MTVYEDKTAKARPWYFITWVDTPDGGRRQVKRRGFATKKLALKAERDFLQQVDDSGYRPLSKDTLGSYLVDRWLPTMEERVRPSTFLGYEKAVRTRIVPRIGDVRLVALDAATIEGFYGVLKSGGGVGGRGLSPKTIANVAGVLSMALSDAVRWGLLRRSPVKDARLPRRPRREMAAWTEDEARAFLGSVRDERLAPLWHLALTTGLRRGELCGLRWTDLDLDSGTLRVALTRVQAKVVVEGEPKTQSSRRSIALDDGTVKVLRSWKARQAAERIAAGEAWQDSGFVFVDELGRPPHPETVSRWWREAIARAGVRPIRLHDARHTAASVMLRSRVPLKVVSQRLGHADVAVTMRVYQHITEADDREAAEALARAYLG